MSHSSLYTELKLALENEINVKMLSSISDVAVVVIGKESIPLLEDLPEIFEELDIPFEHLWELTICDRDVYKAKRLFGDTTAYTVFDYFDIFARFVPSMENNWPHRLLTLVLSCNSQQVDIGDAYALVISITVGHELSSSNTIPSLVKFKFEEKQASAERTPLCETRVENFLELDRKGNDLETLKQALSELKNSCETCSQCSNYGMTKVCPFFQLKIAELYERGKGVRQNLPLAIEWKKKAVRQGFSDASTSLAKTYIGGTSPDSKLDEVFSLLITQARSGEKVAIDSLIGYLISIGKDRLTLPWYARLANSGDFYAQNWLIDAYSNGQSGVPADESEEKAWTDIALSFGNRSFVSGIVDSCIERKDWASAFKWYNRLRGEDDFDQLQLIGIFDNYCEAEGFTAKQYVEKGDQFFYGIDVDEEPSLAFMCYSKAEEMEEPLGSEGLGRCYYYGKGVEKDRNRAIEEFFTPAAEEGEYKSMVELFDFYNEKQKDEDLAEYWRKAAAIALDEAIENNDPAAMRLKSLKMWYGEIFERNEKLCFDLMQRASDLGDVWAPYHLGQYYCHGTGVPEDAERAFRLFEQSAARGMAAAQRCVGCCYERGIFVSKNRQKAFEGYFSAASRGHINSYAKVADFYNEGFGIKANIKEANKWYLKAAEEGNAKAQSILGENYFWGKGIEKDLSQAKKWSVMAAEQGRTDAFFRAAYLCAKKIDGKTEYDKALNWYEALVNQGNIAACNNLGVLYEYGRGVTMDKVKASELYLKAAEGGDTVAMANIAYQFLHGVGVDVDPSKAVSWYTKGLENGNLKCGVKLADEYNSGEILDKDTSKAVELYERVIGMPRNSTEDKEYYVESLLALANIFYFGENEIPEDNKKAYELYRKAAEEGNVDAYSKLGDMYLHGYYVGTDIDSAIYWYKLAAEKGDSHSSSQLEELGVGGQKNKTVIPDSLDEDELPF